jgi:hypothetical protein
MYERAAGAIPRARERRPVHPHESGTRA